MARNGRSGGQEHVWLIAIVRELPPPTSREAYLPQRPERAQKREASELRLT